MKCLYCDCTDSKVIDSRSADDDRTIRRRRECTGCGRRFTTYETIEVTPVLVVKNNGTRQSFNAEKIRNGIIKSCRRKDFARTQLFYAHPYCASERGSNENANRLIRRFLPKGTNLSSLTQKDLDHLAMWMNKYPRKLHDGSSAWQLSKVYSYHFNRISA